MILLFLAPVINAQQDGGPCNSRWSKSNAMSYNNINVYYAIQMNSCGANGVCGWPKVWLWHNYHGPASITLKLKGIDADNKTVVTSFSAVDLNCMEFNKDPGNYHFFCHYIGVQECSIRYKSGKDLYEITYNNDTRDYTYTKNGSKVLSNGKTEEEMKIEAEYNSLISEGDRLMGTGKYDEAEGKYEDAARLLPDKSHPKSQVEKARSLKKDQEERERKKKEEEAKAEEKKAEDKRKAEEKKSSASSKSSSGDAGSGGNYTGYYQTKEGADYQYAMKHHADMQQQDTKNLTAALSLAVAWVGFFLFPEPDNCIYESKGTFVSFAPTMSMGGVNTFSNAVSTTETEYNYMAGTQTVSNSTTSTKPNSMIYIPNFGAKLEFGWLNDVSQLSFPIKGAFGIFTDERMCVQASVGALLFLGPAKSQHLKLGLGYEYLYQNGSMATNDVTSTSGSVPDPTGALFGFTGATASYNAFTTTDGMNNYAMGCSTMKVGFRYQKYFSSRTYNTSEPFVFDMFLTGTTLTDLSGPINYTYTHGIYPGLEINISKMGVFGFYAKVIPMMPVGEVDSPKNITDTPTTSPYFEVGIKREYSWFKRKHPNPYMK